MVALKRASGYQHGLVRPRSRNAVVALKLDLDVVPHWVCPNFVGRGKIGAGGGS